MTLRRTALCLLGTLLAAGTLSITLCPRPTLYADVGFSTAVEDRHGELLRLALADDDRYRLRLTLNEIADSALAATVLYEDRYFYAHPGVNPAALVRAAWSTYVTRKRLVGGSTITMQLARLRFSLNTRTIGGKLVQIARAIQLERHYSKNQILEAYLNLAPYGGNVEGIGTASLVYFAKPASQLSVPEALALAVIPQNPVERNPATASGYGKMLTARNRLLTLWAREHGLTAAMQAQFNLPLAVRGIPELPFLAPHFTRDVLARTRPAQGKLTTTLDRPLQDRMEQYIKRYVGRNYSRGIENAAAMLVDHRSMEVLSAVGSADFANADIGGQVNGTRAKRSPGSTLKPFVYGLAMDQGLIHPMSLLKDAPKRFAAYTPENFDRGFMGPLFARDALIYSRNVPAIELLAQVGHDVFHRFLTEADVANLRSADFYGLAMVLGGNELSMEELVRLYAMLANGGVLRSLRYTQDAEVDGEPPRLLSPEASFLVLDMLRQNPRPDALAVASVNHRQPVAWKTGTSYAFRDAWTIGIVGQYVLAVWVGNFDGSSNPAFVGRKAAAPLFFEIADGLIAEGHLQQTAADPGPDLNLRKVEVCARTGDLPGRYCPRTVRSWFVPGVSPIKVSNVHRAIRVKDATGERACSYDIHRTHEEVFEFWSSDILHVFRQAGIAIRPPPPWAAECSLDLQAANGTAPRITSPSRRLTYYLRPDSIDHEQLPLTATTDADVKWLYWFANDSFVAKTPRDEPVFWKPAVGVYDILAVDDLGRSAATTLAVMLAQ